MATPPLSAIEDSFRRFKDTVSTKDAYEFDRTDLSAVRVAAREIERDLAAKGENRALRRIEPFLTGLGHYSEAIGVLCNGTPYLPWIWAPIKLFLKIASDYLSAFDKLIKAYAEIAEALPRFDRLGAALKNDPNFQAVLAVFYSDILDFHRRAYRFFRARAWKRFFNTTWGVFDIRFAAILSSLRRHAELVDKEANAHDIAEAHEWRQSYLQDAHKAEEIRFNDRFEKVLNWLDIRDNHVQDDDLDRLAGMCHSGTSQWFLEHKKAKQWMVAGGKDAMLWTTGIPGSGKSVLCAKFISHFHDQNKGTTLFFFCNFRRPDSNTASHFLKVITHQLIRQNRKFAELVYEEYLLQGRTSSMKHLKSLISTLLNGVDLVRIFVDGLDECEEGEQKGILSSIRTFVDERPASGTETRTGAIKAVIFSRTTEPLHKVLKSSITINLSQESHLIEQSIGAFVHSEIVAIRQQMDNSYVDDNALARIEERIVASAEGMFLWVHLVLCTLREVHSAHDLELAVEDLPDGVDEAYRRVFDRIRQDAPRGSLQKATVMFSLVAFARWPLKTFELLDAVAFCTPPYQLTQDRKLMQQELERCKPLVEIDDRGRVFFVHFTVKRYILDSLSGPFIYKSQALIYLASACVSYVMTALDLVDPRIQEAQRYRSVAAGLHDLHRYALTNWVPHLEQLALDTKSSGRLPDPQLLPLLNQLYTRYDSLRLLEFLPETPDRPSLARSDILTAFSAFPHLAAFSQLYWSDHNKTTATTKTEDGRDAQRLTLFTEASSIYDATVQQLLLPGNEERFAYIPEPYMQRFRSFHSSTEFVCQHVTCLSRAEGFNSERERDKHERSHQPRFYCDELHCSFKDAIGFSNLAALRKHKRVHHSTHSTIPTFNTSPGETRPSTPAQIPPHQLPHPVQEITPPTAEEIMMFRKRIPNAPKMRNAQIKTPMIRRLQQQREQQQLVQAATNQLNRKSQLYGGQTSEEAIQDDEFPAPAINRITPNSGPQRGGTEVTIFGYNFTRQTKILFGDNIAAVEFYGSERLLAVSPRGQRGHVNIRIMPNNDNFSQFSSHIFTYTDTDPQQEVQNKQRAQALASAYQFANAQQLPQQRLTLQQLQLQQMERMQMQLRQQNGKDDFMEIPNPNQQQMNAPQRPGMQPSQQVMQKGQQPYLAAQATAPTKPTDMDDRFWPLDGSDQSFGMPLEFSNLDSGDVLDNFDFESFLNQDNDMGLGFDASFNFGDGIEAGGLDGTNG